MILVWLSRAELTQIAQDCKLAPLRRRLEHELKMADIYGDDCPKITFVAEDDGGELYAARTYRTTEDADKAWHRLIDQDRPGGLKSVRRRRRVGAHGRDGWLTAPSYRRVESDG